MSAETPGPSQADHIPAGKPPTPTTPFQDPTVSAGEEAPPACPPRATDHRFEVLRRHAEGGLGAVFVARDRELNREVALKEIRGEWADQPVSRARFLLEAEVTGGLEHPGIVPVYALGAYPDGRPFYAMRFIRGRSLREALRAFHAAEQAGRDPGERRLALRGLLGPFVATCNAVAYAHSRGVIHRDLKPDNVMLGAYGETLVVDWGLAKVVGRPETADDLPRTLRPAHGEPLTQAGAVVGTPAYLSPEQADGRADEAGPATDVYGLGATLYALLTGKPPVQDRDPFAILVKVRRGDWPRPRQVKADIPPALEAVCCKAMALRPEQRYSGALELAADVEHWLAGEPVSAWREPWSATALRWLGRHRTLVTAAASTGVLLLLALAVGLALATAAENRERGLKIQEQIARDEARQERDEAKRQRDAVRRALYVDRMTLVPRAWDLHDPGRVRELLAPFEVIAEGQEDVRGWEWHYWDRLCHQELLSLSGPAAGVWAVAFRPDGGLTSAGPEGVRVWDLAAGQGRDAPASPGKTQAGCAVSPDGRRASGYEDDCLTVWEVATGQVVSTVRLGADHGPGLGGVTFSPDGRLLLSSHFGGAAVVRDAGSGKLLCTLPGPRQVLSAAFTPDGRCLATGEADGSLRVWDPGTARVLHHLQGPGRTPATCLAFSPDGAWLAWGDPNGNVEVRDSAGGRSAFRVKGHAGSVTALSFSPDGARLASAGEDKMIRIWDVRGGKGLLGLVGHADVVVGVSFSPDGRRVASAGADRSIKVWDTRGHPEPLALTGGSPAVSAAFDEAGRPLVFSPHGLVLRWDPFDGPRAMRVNVGEAFPAAGAIGPGGRLFAVVRNDGTIRVHDAHDGRLLHALAGHRDGKGPGAGRLDTVLAFAPDGRLASARGATVKVWDAAGGREVCTLEGNQEDEVTSLAFSDDGQLVAAGTKEGSVTVWDCPTCREVHRLSPEPFRPDKGHRGLFAVATLIPIRGVAFSPDGRHLAWGLGNAVKLWDRTAGQQPLSLIGHSGEVSGVSFSPDAKRLASCGEDRTVRVWDPTRGQEMLTLRDHAGAVRQVAFSPDGFRLAAAGRDGSVKVWDATPRTAPAQALREARGLVAHLAHRPLPREEIRQHLREDPTIRAEVRKEALALAEVYGIDLAKHSQAVEAAIRKPQGTQAENRRAVLLADELCREAPSNRLYLGLLGAAQYRAGSYAEAVEALTRAAALDAAGAVGLGGPNIFGAALPLLLSVKASTIPRDLAFLAMAEYRLGRQNQARATLAWLREVLKQPGWAGHDRGLFAEAEALLQSAERK
jgi:WD40 repeat protein/tRNA A-37 threonylcarbamoyl transferase component Bud32